MLPELTAGFCERLEKNEIPEEDMSKLQATVQFLSIKKISSGERVDRYRIIISDGIHFMQAMLTTQLNHVVEEKLVDKNSIVTIENMNCNLINDKRLVVILGLRVEGSSPTKIGEPKHVGESVEGGAASGSAAVTRAPSSAAPSKPAQPSRGQQQRSGKADNIYPIEALSPYQNNWTIRARVTQKSDIRTYANQRGEGKLFNVTFMDETGDIKGTAFNAVVDELYNKLQEDKVYYISKARVDIAKKKFSNNQYELSLNVHTEIEEVTDASQMPVIKYNFIPLANLNEVEKDSMCDVIAIVKDIGELGSIVTKAAQKTLNKRELTLVDRSTFSVRLTLWGKQAEQFQASEQEVVAFKGVKVGDFGGKSLSMVSTSVMAVNPDIPDAHELKGWYMDGGADTSFQAHSREGGGMSGGVNRDEMRTLAEVKNANVGQSDKPEYFSIRATIMSLKSENLSYPACPTEGCNKKVIEEPDGQWRCEKCQRSHDKPQYRYIITVAVADHTDQMWLQGFNDAGNLILDMTADELHDLRERDESAFNELVINAQCKTYNFGVRAKQDTWNDQTRVRYGITRIQAPDYATEITTMLAALKSPWAQ